MPPAVSKPVLCPVCRTDTPEQKHPKECVMVFMRLVRIERHKEHHCSFYRKLVAK